MFFVKKKQKSETKKRTKEGEKEGALGEMQTKY